MDSTLIAKILAPRTNGKNAIGTAYPISKDWVLTARHVVDFENRDASQPISIIWPDLPDPENKKPYAVTATQDSIEFFDGYDIALIRCMAPPKAHSSPLILSDRHPIARESWISMGYAQVGKDGDNRDKVSAMGDIFPPDTSKPVLDLESKGDAKQKEGWKGISGAPVFRGHTLIGVLTHAPEDINERLRAVSIAYLLEKDEKFRELTGVGQRSNNFNSAIKILQENSAAKTALHKMILQADNVADSPKNIIDYLAAMPIPALLKIIHAAQNESRDQTVHGVLSRLLREMLPSLLDPACAAKIRSSKGGQFAEILQIPYATAVSAEILMASADNRPADFRLISVDINNPDRKQAIPGCYKLSLPPESGPATAGQQLEDIQDDLFNRLEGGDSVDNIAIAVDEHLFKKIALKQNRNYTPADKKKLTRNALELDAENQEPGYYWIWSFTDEAQEEHYKNSYMQLAREIKANYPAITLLCLDINTDRECEENTMFHLLAKTQDK